MIIKLKYEVIEGHVHARIMMGEEQPHLSHCGILVFTTAEWEVFKACVANGTLTVKGAEFVESDATNGGSSSSYPRFSCPQGVDRMISLSFLGGILVGLAIAEMADIFRRALIRKAMRRWKVYETIDPPITNDKAAERLKVDQDVESDPADYWKQ